MKNTSDRIANIIGQLQGVERMMDEEKQDCLKVMTQLKAVKSAVSSLMEKYIASEFDCCLAKSGEKDRERMKKIFSEVAKK
jgi:DNA-binding FrmR family transcriptional regulator